MRQESSLLLPYLGVPFQCKIRSQDTVSLRPAAILRSIAGNLLPTVSRHPSAHDDHATPSTARFRPEEPELGWDSAASCL